MLLEATPPSLTETAAYVIVRDSVFGALLVIALVAIYALIRVLLTVQDKRFSDLERLSERMEAREDKLERLAEKMTGAMTAHTVALERLERTESEQTRVLNDVAVATKKVDSTIDSVLREHARTAADAARYGRRPTPPPQYPSDPPKAEKREGRG